MNVQPLTGQWQFRQAGAADWAAATVPGGVHTDLLALGGIPDPFVADNEKKVMWAPPHEMVRSQETLGQAMTRILFLVCGLAPNQIDQYSTLVLGKCNKDISDVAGRKVWPFFVFARVTNLTPTKADLSWMQKDHDFCLSIGSPSFRGATFEALSAVRRRQIMPPQFFT